MSGEKTTNVYKVTAKPKPVAPGRYQGWVCSECNAKIPVIDQPAGKPGVAKLEPADGHVRLICPECHADRLYELNARVRIHIES